MCMMFKLSAYEAQSNVECKSERPGTWGQFETIIFFGICVCFTAVCLFAGDRLVLYAIILR